MAGLSKSAKYYRDNKEARDKKKKYDVKLNSSAKQTKKRVEANAARRKATAAGKNITGKDASHTKGGKIVFKKSSANRGSKSDTAGDRKARGGKSRPKIKVGKSK
jgi:hypothetical protein